MKKYFVYLSVITVLAILIVLNINLSDIKVVSAGFSEKKEYTQQINVSGEFQSKDKTNIVMSYPLYIKEVYVTENSFVNNGQALFSVDKEKMLKILSGQERVDLSQYASNTQMIKYLNSQNSSIDISSIPSVVYATTSGVVTGLNIAPDSLSVPDTTLLTIGSSDPIMAKFSLSQLDYGKVSVGDKVTITPVAFANAKYSGTITNDNAIIKKLSSVSGSKVVVDVFANINDADAKVADGLQINGVVNISDPTMINVLDYTFINQDDCGQYVMIFENGRARKNYIHTGIETGRFTEIVTEFSEDTIFIKGDITEGDRVVLCFN